MAEAQNADFSRLGPQLQRRFSVIVDRAEVWIGGWLMNGIKALVLDSGLPHGLLV
ncbi:hypothetical protein ACPW96_16780 [Micromonospora sp. DT81.3]|uniref:hypothetical protein n=1 Tax=Micromonospora sp. DT81.3 TaxID=3416523 RepID=UPI003CF9C854